MFIELKTGDRVQELSELFADAIKKRKVPEAQQAPKLWAAYVNEKRFDHWHSRVKPRSQILFVLKSQPLPELEIVMQTKEWVVLNKPIGLPTQKTLNQNETNLYDQARLYFILEKSCPVHLPYVGLHHRLDRDTSGLVLMTLQKSANKEIADLFKNRKIKKEYLAWTEYGKAIPQKHWIEKNLIARKYSKKPSFEFSVQKKGDEAITEFFLLESVPEKFHQLRCLPKTGRTHQLRVHLSHLGWPILGDPIYGKKQTAPRLMLHAYKLHFQFKGKPYTIECEPKIEL